MNTWKAVMPEYEIVLWDTSKFDISSNMFVAEAFAAKKWAFAADYIRLHALYMHGGIYLDSDVIVRKRFDEFLHHNFFSSIEYHRSDVKKHDMTLLLNEDGSSKNPGSFVPGIGIQAAILGSKKGHRFLKDCLDWYQGRHFVLEDGRFFNTIILPSILANVAEGYGLRYHDKFQELQDGMRIFPSEVFAGDLQEATDKSYAVHCCVGSWRDKPKKGWLENLSERLRRLVFG